jgi:hypothetical protein
MNKEESRISIWREGIDATVYEFKCIDEKLNYYFNP